MRFLRPFLLLVTTTAAANIGDYVAAGLSLSESAKPPSTLAPNLVLNRTSKGWNHTTTPHTTDGYAFSTFNRESTRADGSTAQHDLAAISSRTASATSSNITLASSTSAATSTRERLTKTASVGTGDATSTLGLHASGRIFGTGASNSTQYNGTYTNASMPTVTLALSGDCWQQWEQYWLQGPTSVDTGSPLYTTTYTTTDTEYQREIISWFDSVVPGTTNIYTETNVGENGGHDFTTYTTTLTYIKTGYTDYNWSINTQSTVTTMRTTEIGTITPSTYYTSTWDVEYPRPSCSLGPKVDATCQSKWISYIANGAYTLGFESESVTKPQCKDAIITGTQCDSLVAAYYYRYTMYGPESTPGYVSTNGNAHYWPSKMSFAPGCTLGCQTCAITGETVQLYYWPPATATAALNGTGIATQIPLPMNITSSGPRIANVSGTLLTSPTIYVSYDKLYASNSCGPVGKNYSGTIIPITAASDLSSISYYIGYMHDFYFTTVPFDLNDLVEPIPESVYNKMPRCQESSYAWNLEGMAAQGLNFSCADLGPYAPVIAVPTGVQNLDPEWKSCTAFYGGLYDPPKALQQAQTAAGITTPIAGPSPTTAASPGSTMTDSGPTKTHLPMQTAASPTSVASPATNQAAPEPSVQTQASAASDDVSKSQADPVSPNSSDLTPSEAAHESDPGTQTSSAGSSDPAHAIASIIGQTAAGQSAAQIPSSQATQAVADPLISAVGQAASASQAVSSDIDESGDKLDPPAVQGSPMLIAGTDGQVATALQSGSAVVVQHASSTVILDPGETGTFAGKTLSALSAGNAVVVDGSQTVNVAPNDPSPGSGIVLTGTDGQIATAIQSGNAVVVQHGSSDVVLDPGQVGTFAGKTLSAASAGSAAVVDGSKTIDLRPNTLAADPAVVLTGAQGRLATITPAVGGGIVIGDSTVQPGQVVTFDGQVLSAVQSSPGVVVFGGSTVTIQQADTTANAAGAIITGSQGQQLQVFNENGNFVIHDGTSVVSVSPGKATSLAGVTISAPRSGAYVVLDGDKTVALDSTATSENVVTGSTGQKFIVSAAGNDFQLIDSKTTTNLHAGEVATFDGRTISIVSGGSHAVVDGTSTLALAASFTGSGSQRATIAGSNGRAIVLSEASDGRLVVADGSSTLTLQSGAATIFDGRTISAGSSGAVVDGTSTLSLNQDPIVTGSLLKTITGAQGQHIVLSEDGSSGLVIADDSSTIALKAGQTTVFDGKTISAGSSGAVIDGTRTVGLVTITSTSEHTSAGPGSSGALSGTASNTSSMSAGNAVVWKTDWSWLMIIVGCPLALVI